MHAVTLQIKTYNVYPPSQFSASHITLRRHDRIKKKSRSSPIK